MATSSLDSYLRVCPLVLCGPRDTEHVGADGPRLSTPQVSEQVGLGSAVAAAQRSDCLRYSDSDRLRYSDSDRLRYADAMGEFTRYLT